MVAQNYQVLRYRQRRRERFAGGPERLPRLPPINGRQGERRPDQRGITTTRWQTLLRALLNRPDLRPRRRRRGQKPKEQEEMPKSTKPPNPKKLPREHWKDQPDDQDYPAATDYLTLLVSEGTAAALVGRLRKASVVHRKAKDLLRASRLPLLPPDNAHVRQDLDKVQQGQQLSPVLLVCGSLANDVALTVADGYHRICASYTIDEDADIPCRIVPPTAPARAR
jgi:hypothetical protein